MDAVVLALASAALFGGMTVALRFALARVADAEAGALWTIIPAIAVTLPFVAAGDVDLGGDLAVPARGRARDLGARRSSSRSRCAMPARRGRR